MKQSLTLVRSLQFTRQQVRLCALLCLCLALILLVACSGHRQDTPLETRIEPGELPNAVAAGTGQENEVLSGALHEPMADQAVTTPARQDRSLRKETTNSGIATSEIRLATPHTPGSVLAEADSFSHYYGPPADREHYLPIAESAIRRVVTDPVSTFSIDVDTAAYSNIRRMLTREGRLPPVDAVRIEEMINYFDYDYPAPDSRSQPLAIHTELMATPWNPDNRLLMVGIQGFEQPAETRPHANLVFLVDVSGSMQSPDKLGLVKKSLQLLVNQMTADDRIALVVYAGAAGVVLDSTPANQKAKIEQAIEALVAGGSTNGGAGIELAYRIAEANKIDGGINRVIIASDGDLNVGVTSIDELKELVSKKRDNGVALTTLGYGTGNYNYSLMEQLADVGNGNAAYIDTLGEARKVLVEEMQSTLLTIARDVKIQIEFNPDVVSEYRLIGYENRLLNTEDFRNDKVDAGEIGSGHTVTALYEISLRGSRGALLPDSRYARGEQAASGFADELAYVNIRYKLPEASASTEFGVPVAVTSASEASQPSENIRFAAAVAGFGQLLRGGKYTRNWGYDELLQLLRQSRGDDAQGYRSELLKLVQLAQVL